MDARRAVLAPKARSAADALLPLMRFGFRTLSAVSVGLAARVAQRVWFTPPRPRLSPASAAFLGTGTRADILVHGRKVAVWSWGEGPAVLLVHGWGGFAAQFQSFVEPLVRAGYRAVAFDAPSHGASGPSRHGRRQSTFFEFADALVELARRSEPVAGVIAHSGGGTSVAWAVRRGWRVPAAVFIAPMGSPIAYQRVFADALGIPDAVMERFKSNVERRLQFQWQDLEVAEVSRFADTPPLLIVHDRDDRETSWRESQNVVAAWPDARLRTTTGLGHNRILREAGVIAESIEFLDHPERSEGSGVPSREARMAGGS
ncbi:MAG TPA: alpha/beta fold hydrolase [Thermoanaerobaculia bacterium]